LGTAGKTEPGKQRKNGYARKQDNNKPSERDAPPVRAGSHGEKQRRQGPRRLPLHTAVLLQAAVLQAVQALQTVRPVPSVCALQYFVHFMFAPVPCPALLSAAHCQGFRLMRNSVR